MDWIVTRTADSTCDAESRSDLPRQLPKSAPAHIGDSITIVGNGDHIKVTVLDVVDPAVIKSLGIASLFAKLREHDHEEQQDLRCVAVRLRMRNLEDASEQGIVQGLCGGKLIDSEGHEYASTGDSTEQCPALWVPKRGEQPKVMCDAFRIPRTATPARYILAISQGRRVPAGEWRLKRSRQAATEAERERDFGVQAQLRLLDAGVRPWNAWRATHPQVEIHLASARLNDRDLQNIDLSRANLEGADFSGSDLSKANLSGAHAQSALFPKTRIPRADLTGCDLRNASFFGAYAAGTCFNRASLRGANLEKLQAVAAQFCSADLRAVRGLEASLVDARFEGAQVEGADFTGALLDSAVFDGVSLCGITLTGAYLRGATLQSATFDSVEAYGANLQGANLTGARVADCDFSLATLVHATLTDATIVNTRVFGMSVWDIHGTPAHQDELVITPKHQPRVTVNDLNVANFVYLLLNNANIRNAIETIGRKGVLILGRFTGRKHVLEAIKAEVGRLDLLPIVFDFERTSDRDFTETVMTLAGLSRFIVADITAPKSVPLELQATVPNYMVPFVPLIAEGEQPFSMFEDLWKKHRDWVLEPLSYASVDQLIGVFKTAVVDAANQRLEVLRMRKAETLVSRKASDYETRTPRHSP